MILDFLGMVLWVLMFIMPLIFCALLWRIKSLSKLERISIGLILGLLHSFLCYVFSMSLIFRDGMGP